MDNEKRIRFAVKGLIIHENKFLAMHKSSVEEDLWELPGGRMEFGETAEETLIREMKEETDLAVRPIRVIDTWNSVRGDCQVTGIIYLCEAENLEVKLSAEHDRYKWIKAEAKAVKDMHKWFEEKMVNWDWDSIKK